MSYQLIDPAKGGDLFFRSCRVLEVSRFGYYDACCRTAKPLLCKTGIHLKVALTASKAMVKTSAE